MLLAHSAYYLACYMVLGTCLGPHQPEAPRLHSSTLAHAVAVQAADNLQYTWEAVAAVADKHGLVTSYLPLPFAEQSGSGCHCHLSLWQVGLKGVPSVVHVAPVNLMYLQ